MSYPVPPPLHRPPQRQVLRDCDDDASGGVNWMRILVLIGGIAFCVLAGVYCVGVCSSLLKEDNSPFTSVMIGPYVLGIIVSGVGLFFFLDRFFDACHD